MIILVNISEVFLTCQALNFPSPVKGCREQGTG